MAAPSTIASPSSDLAYHSAKRVIIIDDVGSILDSAYRQLRESARVDEYDIRPFHYDLNEAYLEWAQTNPREPFPSRNKKDDELGNLLKEFKPDYILMDWGYSVIRKGEGQDATSLFSLNTPHAIGLKCTAGHLLDSSIGPLGKYLKSLDQGARPDVLIYTYNPFDANVFETLTRTQDEFVEKFCGDKGSRGPSLHYIETSAFFNHPRALSLYRGWYSQEVEGDLREIGSEKQLKLYGHFLSVPMKEYLDERTRRNRQRLVRQRIFDEENLRFVRYKRYVSDKLGHLTYAKVAGGSAMMPLKLGALTFYDSRGDILLDIPRKDYYDELDRYASKNGLLKVLYSPGSNHAFWGQDHKNFLYVRLYPRLSTDPKRPGLLDLAIEAWHSNVRFEEKQLRQLVSLLFSSVYYFCDRHGANWIPSDDHVEICQGTDLRVWYGRDNDSDAALEPIDLFFMCQKVETGDGSEGWVNYTLYNDSTNIGNLHLKEIERIVDRILFDIRPAVIAKAKDALLPQLFGEISKQARNASLSQVLSRTMSHNLGSHSLNAFATEDGMRKQFERLEALIGKKTLLPGHIVGVDNAPLDLSDLSKHRRELLARYNNYLRERMDFLADITTAVPAFETRTHFKDDLLKGFAENRLLTTTIAGSPGFDYCWKPELGEGKDDVLVAIPSDVLGRHAFYIILENIVRNSAKHGGHGEGVTYTVELKPMTGKHADLLKVTIKDNKTTRLHSAHPAFLELDADERKKADTVEKLVGERNKNIEAKVLGDDGRVREGAWGMLEMKACAAYLRCVPLEELDETKYHPREKADDPLESREALPLLEAVGDEKGFGYAFYVSRPKDVMVVGEDKGELFPALVQGQKEVLSEYGIGTMDLDTYAKGHVIKHGLLVFHKTTERGLKKFLTSLAADPNARPHEILIVGDVTEDGLAQSIAEANTGQAVQILSGTVLVGPAIAWPVFERDTLLKWASEQRTNWLVAKYKHERIGLAAVRTNLDGSEHGVLHRLRMLQQAGKRLDYDIDYAPHKGPKKFHDELYSRLPGITEKVLSAEATPADLDAAVLSSISTTKPDKSRPIQHFVLRYPSALDRIMAVRKNATQLAKDELGQHHLAYWLSNVAVIDERIQAAVHVSTYTPLVEDEKDREVIQVKHLLDMSGVFVPHRSIDLNGAYDQQLWDRLTTWLDERSSCLSYVVIHLSVFEKFLPNKVIGSIEEGLDRLRKELGHVRIIIASGRGKPPNMPKDELFISYSALSQYLTQQYQRSPLLLSILCRSARRLIQRP